MKLSELVINGAANQSLLRLQRLSRALNVVSTRSPNTGTDIVSVLQHILFGVPAGAGHQGHLIVEWGGQEQRIERRLGGYRQGSSDALVATTLDGRPSATIPSADLTRVDLDTWNHFFHFLTGAGKPSWNAGLVRQLQRHFGNRGLEGGSTEPHNMPFAPTPDAHQRWRREADDRVRRLDGIVGELNSLRGQRDQLVAESARLQHEHGERLRALDREIESLDQEYDRLVATLRSEGDRLHAMEREIADLVAWLDREGTVIHPVPAAQHGTQWLVLYYDRLDELDDQIRRWRAVQTDIQKQRLRLKDEMTVASDLSIESREHPYHDTQDILHALEHKVDQTDRLARDSNPSLPSSLPKREIADLCNQIRSDLEALCGELGRQYRHVRHRAAVAELRQLRHCFQEMDKNVERLLERRAEVVAAIRNVDPEGAAAIETAEPGFMLCAETEGFLAARERLVAGKPLPSWNGEGHYEAVHRDVTAQRNQLADLRHRRAVLTSELTQLEKTIAEIERRRDERMREREALRHHWSQDFEKQLALLDTSRAELERERQSLESRVADDRLWYHWKPNTLLTEASRYLADLSDNQWTQVALAGSAETQILVTDRNGASGAIDALSPMDQSVVRLSLGLAAVRHLGERGVTLPFVVIDNVIDGNDHLVYDVLQTFAEAGHQVIFVSASPLIARLARQQGHAVYEIADTEIVAPNWATEPFSPRAYSPETHHEFTAGNSARNGWRESSSLLSWTMSSSDRIPSGHGELRPGSAPRDVPEPSWSSSRSLPVLPETQLVNTDVVESIYLAALESAGIRTVRQLLDLDEPAHTADLRGRGFSDEQLRRWQAMALLRVSIPDLNAALARVLISCGIDEPEQLEAMDIGELRDRIGRFLDSPSGRRSNVTLNDFSTSRIRSWGDRLRSTSAWRSLRRSRSQSGHSIDGGSRGTHNHAYASGTRDWAERRESGAPRFQRDDAHGNSAGYTFNLQPSDELEAAPSIGPKTAERFKEIDIDTVGEFLSADAEDMASRIQNRRLSKKVIATWQDQTRVMCSIPNLRVHDAQLLVGCGLTTAAEVAECSDEELLARVTKFARSKEGQRMLRSGSAPDLDEVRDWIDAASHSRSLNAA